MTVRNIVDVGIIDGDKPAFIDCSKACSGRQIARYCLNKKTTNIIHEETAVKFFLSGNANANSHSKLLSYIQSDVSIPLIIQDEYVSFHLFNILTFSLLSQTGDGTLQDTSTPSISLAIDTLHSMPTYSEVISELDYILVWVSTL